MDTQKDFDYYEKALREKDEQLRRLKQKNSELEFKNALLNNLYTAKTRDYITIINSHCWRLTAPLRKVKDTVCRLMQEPAAEAMLCSKQDHRKSRLAGRLLKALSRICSKGKNRIIFSSQELQEQKKDSFPQKLTVSILVPLYNTDKKFLKEMLHSVLNQTYGGWELCLADASDREHSYVEEICSDYAQGDARIKYRKLEINGGISANTNACLAMSTGDYLALLDHDDMLHPAALHEVMKAICGGKADLVYTDEAIFKKNPGQIVVSHYKPDYAPDTLISGNYICHFTAFSRQIMETVGGFNSEFDGSQDHDFVLRATAAAKCVAHIPEVLYFWRAHKNSTAAGLEAKPYSALAGQKAVLAHLRRLGTGGIVSSTVFCPTNYRVSYELKAHPLISIIIPNYEHRTDLERCLTSLFDKTTYDNYEIVIVENNSTSPELFTYYEELRQAHTNVKIVVRSGQPFNYSALNNFGVANSSGEVLLFLNNDTEIITAGWLEEMLMYAQRPDVGAVGAKLYYPDLTVQHAGVLLGPGNVAGHCFKGSRIDDGGYTGRLGFVQNLMIVTGACLMVRKSAFQEVEGFEEQLAVAFNDVDFCLKLRRAGYLNVWTPFAELYHYESVSRGAEDTPEKIARMNWEGAFLRSRWSREMEHGDPYYNPNFERDYYFCCKPESRPYEPRYCRRTGAGYEYT